DPPRPSPAPCVLCGGCERAVLKLACCEKEISKSSNSDDGQLLHLPLDLVGTEFAIGLILVDAFGCALNSGSNCLPTGVQFRLADVMLRRSFEKVTHHTTRCFSGVVGESKHDGTGSQPQLSTTRFLPEEIK